MTRMDMYNHFLKSATVATSIVVIALSIPLSVVMAQTVSTDCTAITSALLDERIQAMDEKENPFGPEIGSSAAITVVAASLCADGTTNLDTISNIALVGMLLGAVLGGGGANNPNTNPFSDASGSAQLTSCFNYYGFGSVIPHLSTGINHVVSGTELHVTGTVENVNAYPVVDGALYIKIFKKRNDGSVKDKNGPDVVDQFFAVDAMNIDAGAAVPVAFTWSVPAYAQSGEYEVAAFVTSSKKYNLMGLAFTDDVVGSTFPFVVDGQDIGAVSFQKDAVTVGGTEYAFASYPKHFSATEPIEITAILKNETGGSVQIPVTWSLYRWDQQRRENLIASKNEEVLFTTEKEKTISFTVSDSTQPVYLLVVEAQYKDTHSILNVRFVRDGIEGARINFPSITKFPLQAGEENILFSCIHSMNAPVTKGNEVVLTLNDRDGKEIYSTNYSGSVTGDMMGLKGVFTPRRNFDYVELVVQLFTNGILIEDSRLVYDCKDINPNACSQEGDQFAANYQMGDIFSGLAVVLIILGLGFFVTRSRNEDENLEGDSSN